MARTHIVAEGETLASIALAEGFHDASKLFNAPENAELREKRATPAEVAPGDEVVIPDLEPFKTTALLRHALVLQRLPRGQSADPPPDPASFHFIELTLVDQDGEPIANEPVLVKDSSDTEHEAVSDERGRVHVERLADGLVELSLVRRAPDEWSVEGGE